jgi:hypothetical protein
MGSKGLGRPKDEAPWKEKLSPLRVFGSCRSIPYGKDHIPRLKKNK